MEEPPLRPQDPVQFPIELGAVEVAGQAAHRRIVDDPVEDPRREDIHQFITVAQVLGDRRVIKEGLRPGVLPGDLPGSRVKLDGMDLHGRPRRLDGRVSRPVGVSSPTPPVGAIALTLAKESW